MKYLIIILICLVGLNAVSQINVIPHGLLAAVGDFEGERRSIIMDDDGGVYLAPPNLIFLSSGDTLTKFDLKVLK